MHFSKIQAVLLTFGVVVAARTVDAPTERGLTGPTDYASEAAWAKESKDDVSAAYSCSWYGTAPFCKGECPAGFYEVGRNGMGDGKACYSGTKVYCCDSPIYKPPPSRPLPPPFQVAHKQVKEADYEVEVIVTKKSAHDSTTNALACAWYGTAPFCVGQCPSGWFEYERSRSGGGSFCYSGDKVYCCDQKKKGLPPPFQVTDKQVEEADYEVEVIVTKKQSKHDNTREDM